MPIDPKKVPDPLRQEINAVARALVDIPTFEGSLPESLGFAAIVVGATLVSKYDGDTDLLVPAFGAVIAGYEMGGKRPDMSTPEKMMALIADLTGTKVEIMRRGKDGKISQQTIEPKSGDEIVGNAMQGMAEPDPNKFPWLK